MASVLLAEDTPLQANIIQSFLSDYCTSFKCANNGEEAVWFASVYNPDIAIIDLNLPEKSGFQATKQIKQIDSDIKIVVSTAYDSEQTIQRAINMGADDYLIKPYTRNDLIDSIESVIE